MNVIGIFCNSARTWATNNPIFVPQISDLKCARHLSSLVHWNRRRNSPPAIGPLSENRLEQKAGCAQGVGSSGPNESERLDIKTCQFETSFLAVYPLKSIRGIRSQHFSNEFLRVYLQRMEGIRPGDRPEPLPKRSGHLWINATTIVQVLHLHMAPVSLWKNSFGLQTRMAALANKKQPL
jgi:hypothetical protein